VIDNDMGAPENPEAIWKHVKPSQVYARAGQEDDSVYIVAACECDWEPEHGLLMVWRDGKILNKVGGDDGHITNVYAFDDDSLADVVYVGGTPAFTTRLTT
jgi:hypothetical protein